MICFEMQTGYHRLPLRTRVHVSIGMRLFYHQMVEQLTS
jgi:hypothetical protein